MIDYEDVRLAEMDANHPRRGTHIHVMRTCQENGTYRRKPFMLREIVNKLCYEIR
jgi:hypothetical protein